MKTNLIYKLPLSLALVLIATTVTAHHGSNGQFDHNIKVEVTGVITEAKMVNPHSWVYFDVVGEDGEIQDWRCEMRGVHWTKRAGWTDEMFAPGNQVTIRGSQARREDFGCYLDSITFDDGLTVGREEVIGSIPDVPVEAAVLAPGTPVLHGRWHAPPPRGHVPGPMEAATLEAAWPSDIPKPEGNASFVQTDLGREAGAGFDREDNPRFHCEVTNFFHDWWFNQNVNEIIQSDDKIFMDYGFMTLERTIHLDMDEHPEGILPSREGHSIGWWEGDTLVVETIGYEPGFLAAGRGGSVLHSDQMRSTERFDLSEDGEFLIMTYTIEDPLYLAEPYTSQLTQFKTSQPSVEYNCVELAEERVEGF
jgi:hypothetical protein